MRKNTITQRELRGWMRSENAMGNSIPVVVNGGGLSWLRPDDSVDDIRFEDYEGEAAVLERGDEYADFRAGIPQADYDDMTFVRLRCCRDVETEMYSGADCTMEIGVWGTAEKLFSKKK